MTIQPKNGGDAPLSCDDAVQALWDYLDGQLDETRRERIRAHLAECDHCRSQYTFEGAFLDAMERLVDEPIDTAALRSRIVAALKSKGYDPR